MNNFQHGRRSRNTCSTRLLALMPGIPHRQDTCLVLVQYPDFFGRLYDFTALVKQRTRPARWWQWLSTRSAWAVLKPPGEFGADIVVGEGQPLGIPLSFGGPVPGHVCHQERIRAPLAGRLVGETVDKEGRRAYVLTLTAREQHIRREKATSNICTNQGLIALTSTVYMSLLGKQGLRQVAELCYHKAHYAPTASARFPASASAWTGPSSTSSWSAAQETPVDEINEHLLDHGILGGYNLQQDYPGLEEPMLLAVTE
jgi:glycine dehydrogenase subunit 1